MIYIAATVVVIVIVFKLLYDFIKVISPQFSVLSIPDLGGVQAKSKCLQESVKSFRFVSCVTQCVSIISQSNIFRTVDLVVWNRLCIIIFASLCYSLLEKLPIELIEHFHSIWMRWDSQHYLKIAEHGYPLEGGDKVLLVFYPLYPMLIRGLNWLVGSYFTSAVIISLVSLLGSCIVLNKLVKLEYSDDAIAHSSVKFLLLYPLSFFLSIAYTESLFLFLTVTSFYFIRRRFWFWAGIFGYAAALTRNQGVLLFAPMVYEIFRTSLEHKRGTGKFNWSAISFALFCALLIPMGTLSYIWMNYHLSGDWFKFLTYQREHWGQRAIYFGENISNIYDRVLTADKTQILGIWLPGFTAFVFCLFIVFIGAWLLPAAYTIYALACLIISYSPSWLLSGPRYLGVIFPIFIALALLLKDRPMLRGKVEYAFILMSCFMIVAFLRNTVY